MESQTNNILLLVAIPALLLILMLSVTIALPVRAAIPTFDKSNFQNSLKIDNKYFPLTPGTTYVYKGTSEDEPTRDVFTVTDKVKVILGINTRVVHDDAFVKGEHEESTDDWFAQDDEGTVWYFGEFTTDLTTGSNEGSWEAGVKGAKPGIIMLAQPEVGDTYQQERAKGVAEDTGTILSLNEEVRVPYGSFSNVLKTEDFNPFEPDILENKFYAPDIGYIKAVQVKGGSDEEHLVQIKGKIGNDTQTTEMPLDNETSSEQHTQSPQTVTPLEKGNIAPKAFDQSISVEQDGQLDINLVGNDHDNDPIQFDIISGPSDGSLDNFDKSKGTVTYVTKKNYIGNDEFTFKVIDDKGAGSNVGIVDVTVNAANQPSSEEEANQPSSEEEANQPSSEEEANQPSSEEEANQPSTEEEANQSSTEETRN
jgi:Bacterial Ig domain